MTAHLPSEATTAAPAPPAGDVTDTAGIEARGRVAADCVDLICRLDQLLPQATVAKDKGEHLDAIRTANKMLLAVLDFGESNLDGTAIGDVEDKIALGYCRTQNLQETVEAASWGVVKKVFGRSVATSDEVDTAYQRVADSIAVSVVTAVGNAVAGVGRDSELGRELIQTMTLFIGDLKKAW